MSVFDELRFGPKRTLNLHQGLPAAAEAVQRAERWIREQQVRGSGEVLVITGWGSHSPDGIGVIRGDVEKLLFRLHRQGVVESHHEHNPGAFAVRLAPIRAMVDAIPRQKDASLPHGTAQLQGLSPETIALLRQLSELALDTLGVTPGESAVEDEMHRQLRAIAPALHGGADMEDELRDVLRAAIAEYD